MLVRLEISQARRESPSGRGSHRPPWRTWANCRRAASPKANARRAPRASPSPSNVRRESIGRNKVTAFPRDHCKNQQVRREFPPCDREHARVASMHMAQNTQSSTAVRATVPGTANDEPVGPSLFTAPAKREYVPDAKRVGDGTQAPELAKARELFFAGDYHGSRAEAKRVLKSKD